jgi:tRNA threonylcarbamoyladenosine biosynthesis protein TsaB
MARILSLESSTNLCSVGLSEEGKTIGLKEEWSAKYIHSEKLHVFIDALMREHKLEYNQLDAIAVGKGPGSYTGLRIGVSAAKGFAYALGIPLISIDGLENLVNGYLHEHSLADDALLVPMLDARRMEVYQAVFNTEGERITPITAKIIEEDSYVEWSDKLLYLLGDGAEKCKSILGEKHIQYPDCKFPNASSLGQLAFEKYQSKTFEDVAYFEPFYLKDFVAGKPKKLL